MAAHRFLGFGRRVVVAAALVAASSLPAPAQSTLQLARIAGVPDQFVGGEILREVYARLGIAVEFVDASGARGLALSSSGAVDGEIHRIADVARQQPSLIQITPAINYIEPAVFTARVALAVEGWASLRDYDVGIVRGVGSSEAGTAGMPRVQRATNLDNLMRMLDAGRIDILVTDLFSGRVVLRRLDLEARIRPVLPPLERIWIYHYLHVRHADLAPRVAAVIAAMAGSGALARLREDLVQRVLDGGS
jgi:ABC-type amino acid transport substrate-binding protein